MHICKLTSVSNWGGYFVLLILLFSACSDDAPKQVVCWGDSLTAPHCSGSIKGQVKKLLLGDSSYPGILEEELGGEYGIVNCGVGGENILTIMARQGVFPMQLAHDVSIYEDKEREFSQYMGGKDVPAFVSSYNGKTVTPLLNGYDENNSAKVNPCMIVGQEYMLSSESKNWMRNKNFIFQYNYFISSEKSDSSYILPKGSVVETYAMRHLRNQYANVFFMGQNGGFDSVKELIHQFKAMIDYSGSERFIVISFHRPNVPIPTANRMTEMEDSLSAEFGSHYINLRKYMMEHALQDADLEPTQADRDSIATGAVPPQMMVDGVHFTKTGYKLLGKLVARKFKELGY